MLYPKLAEIKTQRQMVETFRGYNHNLRISDGEFFDMRNMTSDLYPILSPRGKRGVYASATKPTGLIAKDSLCYTDGTRFVINENQIEMGLNSEPKQLISMGAYVIIMPDKKWINTADITQYGSIDASYASTGDVQFSLCDIDGVEYGDVPASSEEPESPDNMQLWIDTSSTHTLKQYSAVSTTWVVVPTTYVKISSAGIGTAFNQYDGVTISGITATNLQELNTTAVVWAKSDNYIVVVGIIDEGATQGTEAGAVHVNRTMPKMDYIVEHDNRLWGCRYGVANNGEIVNEIYASKLGDFRNWNCFMGLSTDSYAASCGTDGQFTGAITHQGYPLFFKENCIHKIYGNYPSNFQIQTTPCNGVQKGCERSLAIVNATLFYKAQHAVCAYDGSLPSEVSYALGNERYSDAVGGAHGNKYYISMKNSAGEWNLFVFDTAKNMWHREDDFSSDCFCSCRGELYAIRGNQIITMLGSGTADASPVEWMVESGEIGISSPDAKYISRLTIRMVMEIGAKVNIYAQHDFGGWEHLATIQGTSLRSFSIPVRPKRCDHLKLKIQGTGGAKIYSITKTIEQGSEEP